MLAVSRTATGGRPSGVRSKAPRKETRSSIAVTLDVLEALGSGAEGVKTGRMGLGWWIVKPLPNQTKAVEPRPKVVLAVTGGKLYKRPGPPGAESARSRKGEEKPFTQFPGGAAI